MIQQLYPSVAHPIVLNLIKILIFQPRNTFQVKMPVNV